MLDLASPPRSPNPSISLSPPSPKLAGTATMIPRTYVSFLSPPSLLPLISFSLSETHNKRGPLAILRDPSGNQWKKQWFVLRRPYLHIYDSSSELEEVAVINVSTVRVEQSPEIEQMLEVRLDLSLPLFSVRRWS
jgi:kinesin family protein 1